MNCLVITALIVLATVHAKPLGLNAVTGIAQAGIGAATGLATGIGTGVGAGVGASLDAVTSLVKGVGSGLTSGVGAGLASGVGAGFTSSVGTDLGSLLLGGIRGITNNVTISPNVASVLDTGKSVADNSHRNLDYIVANPHNNQGYTRTSINFARSNVHF